MTRLEIGSPLVPTPRLCVCVPPTVGFPSLFSLTFSISIYISFRSSFLVVSHVLSLPPLCILNLRFTVTDSPSKMSNVPALQVIHEKREFLPFFLASLTLFHFLSSHSRSRSLFVSLSVSLAHSHFPSISLTLFTISHAEEFHLGSVYSVAWDDTGELLATGSNDKTVRVAHLSNSGSSQQLHASLQYPQIHRGHVGTVRSVCFRPKSRDLFSSGIVHDARSPCILVWDCSRIVSTDQPSAASTPVAQFYGHTSSVFEIKTIPTDRDILFSASADKVRVCVCSVSLSPCVSSRSLPFLYSPFSLSTTISPFSLTLCFSLQPTRRSRCGIFETGSVFEPSKGTTHQSLPLQFLVTPNMFFRVMQVSHIVLGVPHERAVFSRHPRSSPPLFLLSSYLSLSFSPP